MYYVVGCSDCSAYWILEGEQETTTCRSCGTRHKVKKLKRFIESPDKAVVREARAELLAEKAGYGDEYREQRDSHFD